MGLLIGLTIVNTVAIIAVSTTIAAQNTRIENILNDIDIDQKEQELQNNLESEIKRHITKELYSMSFRGIKLK